MENVRILVADRQRLVADGLRAVLADHANMEVVGHASTGIQALELIEQKKPTLLVIDIGLPEMDGIDTTREAKKRWPELVVLAHSALLEIEYVNSMLIEGAAGYLLKGGAKEEAIEAITTVMDGKRYLSDAAKTTVEKGYSFTEKEMGGEYIGLTAREKEVIKLIALEKTNQEIADALFVSLETVKSHRKNLMTKLNVKSLAGLVKYAVDRCWV